MKSTETVIYLVLRAKIKAHGTCWTEKLVVNHACFHAHVSNFAWINVSLSKVFNSLPKQDVFLREFFPQMVCKVFPLIKNTQNRDNLITLSTRKKR
jgi:hypothetical protein